MRTIIQPNYLTAEVRERLKQSKFKSTALAYKYLVFHAERRDTISFARVIRHMSLEQAAVCIMRLAIQSSFISPVKIIGLTELVEAK